MPDNAKVQTFTESLDLTTDGTASYALDGTADLVKVVVTGSDIDGADIASVSDGTTTKTFSITDGSGSLSTTSVESAADVSVTSGVTSQSGGDALGYVKQENATSEGYGNYIGPYAPEQVEVLDNVADGTTLTVTVTGATAGAATLYLDRSGSVKAAHSPFGGDPANWSSY